MTITAVIAEYNPFHAAAAYPTGKSQELTGADYLVVITQAAISSSAAHLRFLTNMTVRSWRFLAARTLSYNFDILCARQCTAAFHAGRYRSLLRLAVSIFSAGSEYGDAAPFLELADVLLLTGGIPWYTLRSASERTFFPTARAQALSAYFSDSASLLFAFKKKNLIPFKKNQITF